MTLTEATIALAVTLLVVGSTLGLVGPTRQVLGVQTQTADLYQRARMASARLHRDILNADVPKVSFAARGAVRPALLPARLGQAAMFDGGAVTLVSTPAVGVPAVTVAPLQGRIASVRVAPGPGCLASATSACGLRPDTTIFIVSDGRSDFLRVTDVGEDSISVESLDRGELPPHGAGALIVPIEVRSYYFDPVRSQIRYENGWATDAPVLDNVVGLSFQFFGVRPQLVGQQSASQSCVDGVVVTDLSQPLAELTAGALTDGPWCRDRYRFDVDLLRVRRVRVRIRLQAAAAEYRGHDTRLFAQPGLALGLKRSVPDVSVQFDVVPRNPWVGR